MKNNKSVEEHLQQSRRKAVFLSDEKKKQLFATIMESSQPEEKKEKSPMRFSWRTLLWPLGVVSVAAVVVVIIMSQKESINAPEHIAEEKEQSILSLSYSDQKYGPTDSHKELTYENVIGGRGGAPSDTSWEVTLPTNLSSTTQFIIIPRITSLTNEQLQTIAQTVPFPPSIQEHTRKKKHYLTTENRPDEYICFSKRLRRELDKTCGLISSTGWISIEYAPDEQVVLDEVHSSMATIFSLEKDDVALIPLNSENKVLKSIEYNIYPLRSLDLPLPYALPPWYVGVKEGQVISLFGYVFSIDTQDAEEIQIVSEQEAAQRLEADIESQLPTATFDFLDFLFASHEPLEEIVLDFSEISLEYHRLRHTKTEEQVLYPLYRFSGIEQNSKIQVDMFVDASEQKNALQSYEFLD